MPPLRLEGLKGDKAGARPVTHLNTAVHMCMYRMCCICISVCCLSICLSIYKYFHPSIYLSVQVSVYLAFHLSIYLCMYASMYVCICIYIYIYICRCVYIYIHIYVCIFILLFAVVLTFMFVCCILVFTSMFICVFVFTCEALHSAGSAGFRALNSAAPARPYVAGVLCHPRAPSCPCGGLHGRPLWVRQDPQALGVSVSGFRAPAGLLEFLDPNKLKRGRP